MASTSPPQPSPAAGQSAQHTYDARCRLAAVPQPQLGEWLEGMPPSNAQYFYSSLISVDDPLSVTTGDARSTKLPLRPFSEEDNNALEASWLSLSSKQDRENHKAAKAGRSPSSDVAKMNEESIALVVRKLAARHRLIHAADEAAAARDTSASTSAATSVPACCDELVADVASALARLFCPLATAKQVVPGVGQVVRRVMVALGRARATSAGTHPGTGPQSIASSVASQQGPPLAQKCNGASAVQGHGDRVASSMESASVAKGQPGLGNTPTSSTVVPVPIRLPATDDGISGTPFLRVSTLGSSHPNAMPVPVASLPRAGKAECSDKVASTPPATDTLPTATEPTQARGHPSDVPRPSLADDKDKEALQADVEETTKLLDALAKTGKVAVGVSRLHTVDLPSLLMKPIYWSPINDISIVQRATWFYQDTMLPVEATVANQLESHYRELRPWTETWAVELRCAMDIGPVGEEKVSQPLWPKPVLRGGSKAKADSLVSEPAISSAPFCAAHCHQGAAAADGALEEPRDVPSSDEVTTNSTSAAVSASATATAASAAAASAAAAANTTASASATASAAASSTKPYANYHVVYKSSTAAFLLKPSLRPSAYYNRRPISKIMKGATIGIPVRRGFDRSTWNRIHEKAHKKQSVSMPKPPLPVSAGAGPEDECVVNAGCPGCEAKKKGHQVTDLVLVVHGVGQKLAERVASFHFTHAVNGLRRAMNIELGQPAVQSILRDDQNGIMVLPVNWRHTLSFDEGGFADTPGQARPSSSTADGFGLKDIEPDSIPAVRSMISDVMFDIPFYMSHHKPKMIQSLVREANRVYRLWCQNNPGFAKTGRVHLIGHSLGSAMSIEVLSRQPTAIAPVDLTTPAPDSAFFEFDTKNLFLLGSPSAFFLLLERGALVPRRGRQKPGVDAQDSQDTRVAGEAGSFGCLAVDNIYNILAKEDPIAYLLNGTIDTVYAASLKKAYVPSANIGFFASVGQSLRSAIIPGAATASSTAEASLTAPPSIPAALVRLPSQLELEVHDFTREEIAERKAYLLNDNGQIDYFLQSGGGPLEMQYLNMLGAHTSYWTNRDLVRLLCVEIGRRPGRAHTLPAMRAVKLTKRLIPGVMQA